MERTAGLDREAKGDGATFNVALFSQKEWDIKVDSSSVGWAVTTKKSERDKGADSFKVVLLPEHMKKTARSEVIHPLFSLSGDWQQHHGGAQEGKATPFAVYSHSRVRGFMLHFHHHLNWKRREASPFMSTTTDCAQAANVAAWYEREGFHNIEVLVIKVDETEWPSQSTMWHVMQTAFKLRLTDVLKKAYCKSEYLIQDYIPASCVTRYRWEDVKANIKAETCEFGQSRKRKRSVFESDHPGDETVLGNVRSRRV
ncbi:hypothetical protein LA080_014041 [Diaporthe eres]|nr:hypothetical protein LA080_014041 [Diaporthe eres]